MYLKQNEKYDRFNIDGCFIVLLYLLPFADALNGYMIHHYNMYGVGKVFHMIVMMFGAFLILQKGVKMDLYTKSLVICVISIFLNGFLSILFCEKIQSISISRVSKILVTLMMLIVFQTSINHKVVSEKEMENIVKYQCRIILMITLITDILGICNYAYGGQRGRIGLYSGSNEPTVIFIILQVLNLWLIIRNGHIVDCVFFAIGELCIIMTESKSGIIISILLILLLGFLLLVDNNKRKYSKIKLLLITFSPAAILAFKIILQKSLNSFVARQTYLYENLGQQGVLNYFSSGRMTRIETLIVTPLEKCLESGIGSGIFKILTKIMFGMGLTGEYGATFEMDYLDLFLYGGIIWFICFTVISIKIVEKCYKCQTKKILCVGLLIVFLVSFFVGHMWNGGNSGIYFALMVSILVNFEAIKKKED